MIAHADSLRVEPPPGAHRLQRWPPAALLAGPFVFLLVFAILRDVPAALGCNDERTDPATLSAYRSGSVAIFVAAEVLTLGVYAVALRAATRARSPRRPGSAAALGAAVGLVAVWPWATHEPDNQIVLACVAGVLAATLTVAAIRAYAEVGWPPAVLLTQTLFAAAVEVGAAWPVWFFAAFAPLIALVVLGVVAAGFIIRATVRRDLAALLSAAAFFAIVILPVILVIVLTRGDQPGIVC